MNSILTGYEVSNQTWFYLSLLLIVAIYFRFRRFWSLRNLDLIILLALAPGLLFVREAAGQTSQFDGTDGSQQLASIISLRNWGYVWLFVASGVLLLRLFLDAQFARRPRYEENLNPAGLTFLCVAAFGFLMTNAATKPPPRSTIQAVSQADKLLNRKAPPVESSSAASTVNAANEEIPEGGRTSVIVAAPVTAVAKVIDQTAEKPVGYQRIAVCLTAILAHLAVILGLLRIGSGLFGDVRIGLSMATLYLLLPCTAYDVGRVSHVLPAAFLIWAIAEYRRPVVSGSLLGLACGAMFFPVFLVPLWLAFYGRQGGLRFSAAFLSVGAVLVGSFLLTSANAQTFVHQVVGWIDWSILSLRADPGVGFWQNHSSAYRLPVVTAFLVMLILLTVFPRKKNIEHLMSGSAAIIVAIQLWYPNEGGAYLLWYLPLMLVVVFRPRLAKHVAPQIEEEAAEEKPKPAPATDSEPTAVGNGRTRLFR